MFLNTLFKKNHKKILHIIDKYVEIIKNNILTRFNN